MPDDEGLTPLFSLPADDDLAVAAARLLLEHGADPALRNKKGRTAIDLARDLDLDKAADLMEAWRSQAAS